MANGIKIDSSGHAYIVGTTSSKDFPILNAFRSTNSGGKDAFVTKLNATGTGLLYSTYLGGAGDDNGQAIAIDSTGRAYVTGFTSSTNFPLTANAFQKSLRGITNAFVTTINPAGKGIAYYSTLLGGGGSISVASIAVDSALNTYIVGHTDSTNFPITSGALERTPQGTQSAFISKIVIAADLAITQIASPNPVRHGSKLTYTLKVINNGPDSPINVTITDAIPFGTTFVSFATSTASTYCTAPAVGHTGTLTCVRSAALPRGGTITISLVVGVYAKSGSTITNNARVSARMQDLKPSNNTSTVKTSVD